MEHTMETCPNCGAVARPGAKFCTTCGTRLSGIATPPPTTGDTPSPLATSASGEGFVASPTAAPASEPGSWAWGSATTEQAGDAEASAPEANALPNPPAWTWPASGDDNAPAPGDVDTSSALVDTPTNAIATTTATTTATAEDGDDAEQLSSWAARWNDDTWSGQDASPSPDAPAADPEPTTGIEGAPAGLDVPTDSPATDELPTLPDTGAIELPAEEPGDPGFAGIEGAPAGNPDALAVAEEIAETEDSGTNAGEGFGLGEGAAVRPVAYTSLQRPASERAAMLVNELRGLIPQLVDATEDGTPTPATVREVLAGALGTRTDDTALRATVQQVEANPRDIYAMMDLGRQVGTISALIEERDRLRTAIEEAIDAVREPES